MIVKETLTFIYKHCGECSNADVKCYLKNRKIPDLWGKIPRWCPLERVNKKEEKNGKLV